MAIVSHSWGKILIQSYKGSDNPLTRTTMITRIQKPKKDKDDTNGKSIKNGSPKILAGIPKKDRESNEEFAKRFIEKLSQL